MKVTTIEKKSLLSTLWVFILINMLVRDLHQMLNKAAFEEMFFLDLPEEQVLLFGIVLEIPILMIVLSGILPGKVNRWLSILAAIIMIAGFVTTLAQADLDDLFFAAVNSIALVFVVIISWKPGAFVSVPK